MKSFTIFSYDFDKDELFEKFFQSKLPNKPIPRPQFIYKLNQCKREWIKILNSALLRLRYDVPMDWGE